MTRFVYVLFFLCYGAHAQLEGIYCGKQTCYDVLGVSRDDDILTIQRIYRNLAKRHHPDRWKAPQDKADAEERFRLIATAYEILRDPAQKLEYDYMLDNPAEMYYNYYRYFKRQYSAKIDVRLVIASTILILSTIQYVSQRTRYEQAISYLVRDPKHRNQARSVAVAQNRFRVSKEVGKRRLTREELKEREEQIIREVIKETIELRGDCAAPSIRRTLLLQLCTFPYYLVTYMHWALRWIVLFWVLRRQYGPEEQEFLTRYRLGCTQARWDGLEPEKRVHYMQLGIWEHAKYKEYLDEKEEEWRLRAAEDSNQKRYRRYMKRTGPPGINLEDL